MGVEAEIAKRDAAIAALLEQVAELQTEFQILKAGIADERWQQVAANFETVTGQLVHLDNRLTQLNEVVDELRRERSVP